MVMNQPGDTRSALKDFHSQSFYLEYYGEFHCAFMRVCCPSPDCRGQYITSDIGFQWDRVDGRHRWQKNKKEDKEEDDDITGI